MSKQLAIMSEPQFGMRDMSKPGFWFEVSFGENLNSGALIVLPTEEFARIIEDADIRNMHDLKNHACQIDVSDNNYVTFIKVIKK